MVNFQNILILTYTNTLQERCKAQHLLYTLNQTELENNKQGEYQGMFFIFPITQVLETWIYHKNISIISPDL